ncbi:MAG: hypothetical protein HYR56_13190 [Acidobacteria bacterium]|nr:hypothetical protein [Acidobacteriota bacterium]MBI3428166.1 hypothetical protein [Acidobacteriota bacterium]
MKPSLSRVLCSALLALCASLVPCLFARRSAAAQSAPLNLVAVSAATLQHGPLARGSLVSLFGSKLATTTAVAVDTDPAQPGVQLPYSLGGTTVRVAGQLAQLLFVSPQQVNLVLPDSLNLHPTYKDSLLIEVLAGDSTFSAGTAEFADSAPGVFTANGSGKGLPAGTALRVRADGTRVNEPLFTVENGVVFPLPVELGPATDRLILTLFATGLRNAPDANADGNLNESVRLLANGYETAPDFVGVAPGFPGVEQINWEIPRSLLGQARLELALEVNGAAPTTQALELPLALPPLGALTWRLAGLDGKRITALLSTASTTFAGTEEGIFRTPNATTDWRLVNYSLPGVRRVTALFAVSNFFPNPGLLLLAGVESGGAVLSAFGATGDVWVDTPITTVPVLNGKKVRAFAANTTYVFAGGDDLSVARLNCCNRPWEPAGAVFAPRVNALAANGARIFAGTAANGLFLSTDNGNTWAQNNGGIPLTAEVRALVRPGGNTLLAGTANGLYRSTDNGASWTRVTEGVAANAAINAFALYGTTVLAGTTTEGVLVSTDGGARWQALGTGLTNPNVLALTVDGNRLLAGTSAGVFGATITANLNRAPLAESQSLTLDEDSTKSLTLAGTDPDGDRLRYDIVRGPAHGYLRGTAPNLAYIPNDDYFGADQFEFRVNDGKIGSRAAVVRFTINPVNDPPQLEFSGERLLLAGQFSNLPIQLGDPDWLGLSLPPRLTLTATGLPEGARISPPQTFVVTPSQVVPGQPFDTRRLLWVPTTPGSYTINFTVSDDGAPPLSTTQSVTLRVADNPEKGAWTPVNSPVRPPRTDLISNLFADGSDLYAVTNEFAVLGSPVPPPGFWRSTDGGATWKDAGNGLSGTPTVLARAGNMLFVGTDQGVFRSPVPAADGTPSWTAINTGLPVIRAITSLAVRDNKLVIATLFGLFLSTNQGASWTSINGNLPLPALAGEQSLFTISVVTSVVFNGDTLFASIVGRSIGILAAAMPDPAEVAATFAAQTEGESEADLMQQTEPVEGVFRSTDNGVTWTPVNRGLGLPLSSNLPLYGVANLTVSGTTLYANTSFGLFRSANQGERWQRVPTPFPNLFGLPTVSFASLRQALATEAAPPLLNQIIIGVPALLVLPSLPPVAVNGKLYLAPYGSGVYASREDGSDWLPLNQGLDEPNIRQLFAAGNRLYAVTANTGIGISDGTQQTLTTRIFTRNLAAN